MSDKDGKTDSQPNPNTYLEMLYILDDEAVVLGSKILEIYNTVNPVVIVGSQDGKLEPAVAGKQVHNSLVLGCRGSVQQ